MVRNGKGQSSHVLVFCVNLEVHISVLVANYSCSFVLVVGEKNYIINIFIKHLRHYYNIHLWQQKRLVKLVYILIICRNLFMAAG